MEEIQIQYGQQQQALAYLVIMREAEVEDLQAHRQQVEDRVEEELEEHFNQMQFLEQQTLVLVAVEQEELEVTMSQVAQVVLESSSFVI